MKKLLTILTITLTLLGHTSNWQKPQLDNPNQKQTLTLLQK